MPSSQDPCGSADGYNAWYMQTKYEISRPTLELAAPVCIGESRNICVHSGAVLPSAGAVLYYQVYGVCDGVESPR